jgi:hypothetical protein
MLWPVAALAVAIFGFVVVYGSVMQSRLNAGLVGRAPDPATETEQSHSAKANHGRVEAASAGGSL